MSVVEAQVYVDLVVEKLVEWGVITQTAYGKMSGNQRQELAELVSAQSDE